MIIYKCSNEGCEQGLGWLETGEGERNVFIKGLCCYNFPEDEEEKEAQQ